MHPNIIDVEFEGAHMRIEGMEGCSRAALFLPGISGGALGERFTPLADMLREAGWACARLEIWNDAEDAETRTISSIHDVVRTALHELESEGYLAITAIGKSFGGGILLSLNDVRISKKILWAPAIGCAEEGNLQITADVKLMTIKNLLDIKVSRRQVADDPSGISIIHGTEDSIIPIENSDFIMEQRGGKVIRIEGADHSFKVKAHEEALLTATKTALGS